MYVCMYVCMYVMYGTIHLRRPHGVGEGGQAQVEACGWREGGQVHADVHTENLEIYDLRVKI